MPGPIERTLAVAIATLLAPASFAERLEVSLVTRQIVQERLAAGKVSHGKRQATIRELFADAGCVAEEQRVSGKTANVICTLPGETTSMIVVGGHFDYADSGAGIVDDWSGASLLPSLYAALKNQKRKHTYLFVAFAAEERGLVGSSRFVAKLSREQRASLRAFVNLECLGLGPVKVWIQRATPELVTRLSEVAAAVNIPMQGVNVDNVGDDDSHPFLYARLPVITLQSITQQTLGILHSMRDQVKAVRPDDYYEAYRLVAFYLAYLDSRNE
jgi:Zn-dependent M28 family amino/carboxypeptidase